MKVVVDPTTFSPSFGLYSQGFADRTVQIVDSLIPGKPQATLLCYRGIEKMPKTIWESFRYPFEPAAVRAGDVRIALNNDGNHPQQFVFQLSHESAHVKMGPGSDSYLTEVFATAVSIEALKRFGWAEYAAVQEAEWLAKLPKNIRHALQGHRNDVAALYWQQHAAVQEHGQWNSSLEFLGVRLLRDAGVSPQPYLLNFGTRLRHCLPAAEYSRIHYCGAIIEDSPEVHGVLKALALVHPGNNKGEGASRHPGRPEL